MRSFQNSSVFKTGFCNFHKLTTIVLKQHFLKLKLKVANYSDFQKLCNDEFIAEAENDISKDDINNMEYQHFLNIFIKTLNQHASMRKKKNLRANQGRFMTKDLHKGILKYSRLRNNFLRNRTKTCIEKNTKKITRLLRKPLEKIHKRTFGKI